MTFAIAFLATIVVIFGVSSYLKYRMKERDRLLNEKLERHFKDD